MASLDRTRSTLLSTDTESKPPSRSSPSTRCSNSASLAGESRSSRAGLRYRPVAMANARRWPPCLRSFVIVVLRLPDEEVGQPLDGLFRGPVRLYLDLAPVVFHPHLPALLPVDKCGDQLAD